MPTNFSETNPTETPIHLVKILIKMTAVNEIDISIPSKVKNPAKLLSTTPIPKGRKDMKPNIIDDVYMDNVVRKFKFVIPKDVRT
jgi:hypothetical protein